MNSVKQIGPPTDSFSTNAAALQAIFNPLLNEKPRRFKATFASRVVRNAS
jgi:hypothetical protein